MNNSAILMRGYSPYPGYKKYTITVGRAFEGEGSEGYGFNRRHGIGAITPDDGKITSFMGTRIFTSGYPTSYSAGLLPESAMYLNGKYYANNDYLYGSGSSIYNYMKSMSGKTVEIYVKI